MIKLNILSFSKKGDSFKSNRDNIFIEENKESNLVAICDGMNSLNDENQYFEIINKEIMNQYKLDFNADNLQDWFYDFTLLLNKKIFLKSKILKQTLGTTFSGILFHNDVAILSHVGDSFIFQKQNNELNQITEEHIFYQNNKKILSKILGNSITLDLEIKTLALAQNYYFFTDGIFHHFTKTELEKILKNSNSIIQLNQILTDKINSAKNEDDCSFVLIETSKM